jgi:AT-rich interactive domain-containing protein 1
MPPPAPQPRRHPDFVKDQPYPGYNQQRPAMYPQMPPSGWSNTNNAGAYRAPYPGTGAQPQQQGWSGAPRPPQQGAPQWPQPPYQPPQSGAPPGAWGIPQQVQNSPLRPPIGARPPFRPTDPKQFPQMQPPQVKVRHWILIYISLILYSCNCYFKQIINNVSNKLSKWNQVK